MDRPRLYLLDINKLRELHQFASRTQELLTAFYIANSFIFNSGIVLREPPDIQRALYNSVVTKRKKNNIKEGKQKKRKKNGEEQSKTESELDETNSDESNNVARSRAKLEVSDFLSDTLLSFYKEDNIVEFLSDALRYKILFGWVPYTVEFTEDLFVKFSVHESVLDNNYSMKVLDFGKEWQYLDSTVDGGIYLREPLVSFGEISKDIVYCKKSADGKRNIVSHSNIASEAFKQNFSNMLIGKGKPVFLFMHVWDLPPNYDTKPNTPIRGLLPQLQQKLNSLSLAHDSFDTIITKKNVVLESKERPSIPMAEIQHMQYQNSHMLQSTADSALRSIADESLQERVAQSHQYIGGVSVRSTYDPVSGEMIKKQYNESDLQTEYLVPEGLQKVADSTPSTIHAEMDILYRHIENIFHKAQKCVIGISLSSGIDKSGKINKMREDEKLALSNTIDGHKKSMLQLLNNFHANLHNVLKFDFKIEDSSELWQVILLNVTEKNSTNTSKATVDKSGVQQTQRKISRKEILLKTRKQIISQGFEKLFSHQFSFAVQNTSLQILSPTDLQALIESEELDPEQVDTLLS